jgi:adenylate kinase
MPKIIYLTGAPAAGKSSTARLLEKRVSNLEVWQYGARLTAHVRERQADVSGQDDVRRLSAKVITQEDVSAVDDELLTFVAERRGMKNVIIDSHAVTKESYGFRITPFSLQRFAVLAPNEIWMLYTNPDVAMARIAADAGGRPMIDAEQARMHTALQASVAATYGMSLGIAVHLFDSSGPQETLVDLMAERLT